VELNQSAATLERLGANGVLGVDPRPGGLLVVDTVASIGISADYLV